MKRISVLTQKKYDIIIDDSFDNIYAEFSALFPNTAKLFVITDKNVGGIYADELLRVLADGFNVVRLPDIQPGENSKSIEVLTRIYEQLLNNGADRSSVIIALGGGVVGDIAGFAAATYMRGVKYAQIPTTLLSQVDSSVGGKTAVDFLGYKNIIGAFYQPDSVYINTQTLESLPVREFSAGMAEVVKYGLIADDGFYSYIIENISHLRENSALEHIISRCVEIKAGIVASDEKETGLREILNFGHTIGHAVESLRSFELLHGEAVALGMRAALEISKGRGGSVDLYEFAALMDRLGLPRYVGGICAEQVYEAALKDKKSKAGKNTYVLVSSVGSAGRFCDIDRDEVLSAVKSILKEG